MKKGDEVTVLPTPICGTHMAVKRTDAGIQTCVLKTGECAEDGADSHIELERIEGSRFRVKEAIAFTARSRPSTNAYRSGWDAVYGDKRRREASN